MLLSLIVAQKQKPEAFSSIFIVRQVGKEILIISFYMDDLLLASHSFKALIWLKNVIVKEYNVKNLG